MPNDSAAIEAVAQEYADAVGADDLDRWMETLSDDIVFLPPGHPPVSGKDAVRRWAKESFFDPFRMRLDYAFDEVEVAGPWAFVRGRFTLPLNPKDGSEPTEARGNFLDVYRKDGGAWKYARVCFNFTEGP